MDYDLPGDSTDYYLLTKGVKLSKNIPGCTLEIGLRRGGGTKYIIDAIAEYCPWKIHIAVDPYGSIMYADQDNLKTRLDYTNEMAGEALPQVFGYAWLKKVRFIFFQLEDTEFFTRFNDGIPVYDQDKKILAEYSFIHIDGPHDTGSIINQVCFFSGRMKPGSTICFDDIINYNHAAVEDLLILTGFILIEKTDQKALYQLK
jgi:flavodoxin